MRKTSILGILCLLVIISANSFKTPLSNPTPPSGYTGAPTQNRYCTNCHGDFSLNTAGGSVYTTGLPSGSYIPGQAYNFSITITSPVAEAVWGFEIKACVAGTGTAVGTFSTTNPNVILSSSELKHGTAVVVNGTSYTYDNLTWTAPSTGGATVNFYFTGVAGDNDNSEAGDYVYSGTISNVVVPVKMGDFTAVLCNNVVRLDWQTYFESDLEHFEIERSTDGINYAFVESINGMGNSNTTQRYHYSDQVTNCKDVLYYRLKILDRDGSYEYSKTIRVKIAESPTSLIKLYPTMVGPGDEIHAEMLSAVNQSALITFYNVSGEMVGQQTIALNKGINSFTVGGPAFRAYHGIMLMKVMTSDFKDTRKILIR